MANRRRILPRTSKSTEKDKINAWSSRDFFDTLWPDLKQNLYSKIRIQVDTGNTGTSEVLGGRPLVHSPICVGLEPCARGDFGYL